MTNTAYLYQQLRLMSCSYMFKYLEVSDLFGNGVYSFVKISGQLIIKNFFEKQYVDYYRVDNFYLTEKQLIIYAKNLKLKSKSKILRYLYLSTKALYKFNTKAYYIQGLDGDYSLDEFNSIRISYMAVPYVCPELRNYFGKNNDIKNIDNQQHLIIGNSLTNRFKKSLIETNLETLNEVKFQAPLNLNDNNTKFIFIISELLNHITIDLCDILPNLYLNRNKISYYLSFKSRTFNINIENRYNLIEIEKLTLDNIEEFAKSGMKVYFISYYDEFDFIYNYLSDFHDKNVFRKFVNFNIFGNFIGLK